jgi:CPA2 family monovalent cation:H+ antiporter-2
VVIAGAGRVGRQVAQGLQQFGTPFVVIDFDQRRIDQARSAGWSLVYGDAAHPVVLHAAGLEKARLALVTVPTAGVARSIVDAIRAAHPQLDVVVRAEGIDPMQTLHEHGVFEVVQPELEASLEMLRQSLLHLGVAPAEILSFLDRSRRELYAPLRTPGAADRGDGRGGRLATAHDAGQLLALRWVVLPEGSPFVGRSIAELAVRSRTGVSIVAVSRGREVRFNPATDFRFAAGDWIAVIGADDQVEAATQQAAPASTPAGEAEPAPV